METKIITIKDNKIEAGQLDEAAAVIRNGGLVAFPTETVYGLGANALSELAAKKIYEAKGRPSDNPLIAHIADAGELYRLVKQVPESGRKLMENFWPGPLTIIFEKSEAVPYGTTGGLDTVAVRMPDHPVAAALIRLAGVPIAAPSANTSGRPSPTTAQHVYQDLAGCIDMIVDGGEVGIGVESTIVDVSETVPTVLRPGAITLEMLQKVLGRVQLDRALAEPMKAGIKPKAPGMKYRHYAPKAALTLVEGRVEEMVAVIQTLASDDVKKGIKVGIICTDETKNCYPDGLLRSVGTRKETASIAHNLYAVLREFDGLDVDEIYSEAFSKDKLGQAVMNRLTKAAGYHIMDARAFLSGQKENKGDK